FPLRHPDSQNFDPGQVFQWLRDLVASDVRIVTHNGLYDWGWLRTEAGIAMPRSDRLGEIGALATAVADKPPHSHLAALAAGRGLAGQDRASLAEGAQFLNLPKRGVKPQSHIWEMPARFVGSYAEGDASCTLALWENLNPVLAQEDTRAAYRLEIDLL